MKQKQKRPVPENINIIQSQKLNPIHNKYINNNLIQNKPTLKTK